MNITICSELGNFNKITKADAPSSFVSRFNKVSDPLSVSSTSKKLVVEN